MKRILAAGLVAGLSFTAVAQADSFQNFSEAAGDSAQAGARVAAAGGQVYDWGRFFMKCLNGALNEYGELNRKTLYKFGQEFVITGKIHSDQGIVHDQLVFTPENYPDPEFGPGKWMFPIVQYHDGQPTVVWPPSQRTGELIIPEDVK